ncbi:MAG: beta-N-acetylglucosaminidase domain-containing protein [Terriglobia bacterium]
MKNLRVLFALIALGIFGVQFSSAQTGSWALVYKRQLDPRISTQINRLAKDHGANLTVTSSLRAARASGAGVLIELKLLRRDSQLLKMLRRADSGREDLTQATARQGYGIEVFYGKNGSPLRLRITASEPVGFHNALLRIPQILHASPSNLVDSLDPRAQRVDIEKHGRQARVADFPSFVQRGIVEGFYGPPWSEQDRLDILRFEGDHGMNVYFYAPKDDPYHRDKWRDLYPADLATALQREIQAAHDDFVDFCFAISPGLSMTYSSDADFASLTSKLDSVAQMGVSCFALFLDDIPQQLQNPADLARFKDLGSAHVYLINKLNRYLKSKSPENHLVVTPTTYTNAWGSRAYVMELGKGVDPDVPIAWTGAKVVSPTITLADATAWSKLLERKLIIWDNFPVNDGIPWRLILAPLVGRDPQLPEVVEGLFSNPMIQAHASMIALQTVADYLWAPKSYEPRQSLVNAVQSQYGPQGLELLGPFLKTYGDYWWDENFFQPLYSEQRQPIDAPSMETAIGELKQTLAALSPHRQFAQLLPEISPFPAQTEARLQAVRSDPAFQVRADGKLEWNPDYDVLRAFRVSQPPRLDGDFSKWERGPVYVFESPNQIVSGSQRWKGPDQFSARVALRWDDQYLYIGISVKDPNFYCPPHAAGGEAENGMRVFLETAFQKNFLSAKTGLDEHEVTFTPGDFASVPAAATVEPKLVAQEPSDSSLSNQIKAFWKKTPSGYSADFAIPAAYFSGQALKANYAMGMSFLLGKAVPAATAGSGRPNEDNEIIFTSKADQLFPVRFRNPATYQRLILTGP